MFDLDLVNKAVLDMGCGTGVLAILAKKLGSDSTVGIDIDEWSVQNSLENIDSNHVSDIDIIKGDADNLRNLEKFDVILANINRNILLNDMDVYVEKLNVNGDILFSGFYVEDNSLIQEKAEKLGLKQIDHNERDNWSLLHFRLEGNL